MVLSKRKKKFYSLYYEFFNGVFLIAVFSPLYFFIIFIVRTTKKNINERIFFLTLLAVPRDNFISFFLVSCIMYNRLDGEHLNLSRRFAIPDCAYIYPSGQRYYLLLWRMSSVCTVHVCMKSYFDLLQASGNNINKTIHYFKDIILVTQLGAITRRLQYYSVTTFDW